ncbi:HlyD family efflux transporter periplasmic adaptor subunit [uncultured Salinicola sp.]|uniref:HlyD family secretion protein n=1 Tax=uncultured Salinicola sp. TaxID=1193542 RepID=UPI00262EC4E9|nr:HlyD family efflux transporter periplasmic adaptor subunit [uncultured Salinicola sp.]|tara:strand:+ start:600 stop:1811 length:1212 start_codon:yes stop_codon:yes gene_type:complete
MSDDELFRNKAVEAQNVMNGRVRVAPPTSWTATTVLLGVILAGAIAFASMATFSRTVEVKGSLDTVAASMQIVAPARGRVRLSHRQGDDIEVGETIAVTRLETLSGDDGQIDRRRDILQSEIDDARRRADAARQAGEARASANISRARAARQRGDALASQLEQARRQTAVAITDLDRARSIAERGFLSKRDLESRESEVSRRRQEEARIAEEIARAHGEALEAEALATQARSESVFSAEDALQAASRARRDLAADEAVRETRHDSDIAGRIASLPVKDGETVDAGQIIAIVVPEEDDMVAVMRMPAGSMSDLREGQEIGVSVDAYPYQTYGMIKTRISRISRFAVEGKDGPEYEIEANMPKTMMVYGEPVALLPGMTLTARITTRRRSIMEWILEPLYAVGRR